MTLRNVEEAGRLLEAEGACDDPLRMAACVLTGKAVRDQVLAVDPTRKEPGPKRAVRRPLVTLRSQEPCRIPVGRELWWTGAAAGTEYTVEDVVPGPGGGSDVVLKLMTSTATNPLPLVGASTCFSVHSTNSKWLGQLPDADPWTHIAPTPTAPLAPLEPLTPEA